MEGKRVLITGASGLIGQKLSHMLLQNGYSVMWLSRSKKIVKDIKVFTWDPSSNFIEDEAILNADHIIHLAGANIFEQRWSDAYKNKVIASRTRSADMLLGKVKIFEQPLQTFISASAIGIHGMDTGSEPLTETSPPGSDFLAEVVKAWESHTVRFSDIGVRTVIFRIGVVFAQEGGALQEMVRPVRLGIGAPLGTGDQYISWIHVDDLCQLFLKALQEKSFEGIYNAVSPMPITNCDLTRAIANKLQKPLWLPKVPGFVLRLLLGERAGIVLGGNFVVPDRLNQLNHQFRFNNVEDALEDLCR